jgi:hypothetical protein
MIVNHLFSEKLDHYGVLISAGNIVNTERAFAGKIEGCVTGGIVGNRTLERHHVIARGRWLTNPNAGGHRSFYPKFK